MKNIRPPLEHNLGVTIVYLTFAVPGTLIGLAQWLVVRKKVPRVSPWWILTNIPGLYLGTMSSYLVFFVGIGFLSAPLLAFEERNPTFISICWVSHTVNPTYYFPKPT
ncbi:hypothetical protein F7734_26215 [Scytonema sp. UIC 10036]|uniref:hypothetical protein n=1 Tax=Scytonema sp. UIC 10036 TaxID=2304196 RepID=UPI0012DA1C8B|nr:hypothetical protein [Scytonema sp. UIC 10036]MUG95661.1 hypothetical protein [Scytonema sp. UIC 10036]